MKSESKVPKSVLNEFTQKVASDLDRTVLLGDLDGVEDISINIGKFNLKNSKISALFQVVKKREMSLSWALTKYRTRFIKNAPEL